jgi:hypothetical protein
METSTYTLEEEAREFFLDMGIFLEARKFSIGPFLDLGVYVHKLKWIAGFYYKICELKYCECGEQLKVSHSHICWILSFKSV